jgi:alpha-L-fucosidase
MNNDAAVSAAGATHRQRHALLLGALVAMHAAAPAPAQERTAVDPRANETVAQHNARMKWWREARFGMFIHWGLYSVPAGVYDGAPIDGIGEWIMRSARIPVARYAAYADGFNPVKFDATQWVAYAKAAGMKYIVMTAKHHEGFAMYPTAVDDYRIGAKTGFTRDPIGEMAAAARKAGIRFGVYYSQNLDWHHPGGGTYGPAWDDAQKGSFDAYVRTVAAPQVEELLSRYKPAVLWWDIPAPFTPDQVRLLTASFARDPGLIANNRLGGGVPGDIETPEQFIPGTGIKGKDWETCMTINDTWGYKSTDHNFKSTPTLLRNLIDIASKGGNYLLNVGPTSEGIIPAEEVQRLTAMGQWMKANGGSIYATSASPYRRLGFEGRATVKGNTLYLNVFRWPSDGLTLVGLQNAVRGARVLATGEMLTARRGADGTVTVSRPRMLDSVSTALALALDGAPRVNEPELQLGPDAKGNYELRAADAEIDGATIQLENEPPNLGYWTDPKDAAHWVITVPAGAAGAFRVTLEYACDPGSEGSSWIVTVDGSATGVGGVVGKTKSWDDYVEVTPGGTVTLTPGRHTLRVGAVSKPGMAVMNLRKITLTPAR